MNKRRRWPALALALAMVAAALPTGTAAYSDVPTTHWAAEKINQWTSYGYMEGYTDGTFRPDGEITRAEFVKITNRAFGLTAGTNITFPDVPSGHWAYQEIRVARGQGYISGYPDGTFKPGSNITRQEAAKIICTILGLSQNPAATYAFDDSANIDEWARGFVGAVYTNKVMGRYGDGTFRARQNLTRAECVDSLWNGVALIQPIQAKDMTLTSAAYQPATPITVRNLTIDYAGDVTVSNVKVEGSVMLTSKANNRTITLSNSTVAGSYDMSYGNLVLDGVTLGTLDCASTTTVAGSRTVTLKNATTVATAITDRAVSIDQSGLTGTGKGIELLYIGDSVSATVTLKGNFPNVYVNRNSQSIVLLSGSIANLDCAYSGLDLLLGQGAVLTDAYLSASAVIEGPGTVQHAYLDSTGVSFQRTPDKLSGPRSPSYYSGDWKLGFTATDVNSGKAISGATVTLGGGWATGKTDSKGYIEFSGIPNRSIPYTITATGYTDYSGTASATGTHRYPSAAMTPTGSWRVTLTVQNTSNQALSGAWAVMDKTGLRTIPTGGSGTDGKIYFENLGNSTYTCKVSAPGYVSQTKSLTVNGKDLDGGTLKLSPTQLTLTAYDESTRQPLSYFTVNVNGTVYKSVSGKATIPGLNAATSYSATVTATDADFKSDPDYKPGTVTLKVEDSTTATAATAYLSVSRVHPYSVLVRNWNGIAEVPGATVTLASAGFTKTVTTGSDGIANFGASVPESQFYKLTVSKAGYQGFSLGKDSAGNELYVTVDAANANYTVNLTALRTATFTVTQNSAVVANIKLTLESAGGTLYTTGNTDQSGKVSISNIPEGVYTVTGIGQTLEVTSTTVIVSGETNNFSLTATEITINFKLAFTTESGATLPTAVTLRPEGVTDPLGPEYTKTVNSATKLSDEFSLPMGTYTLEMTGSFDVTVPTKVVITKDTEGATLPITVRPTP